MRLNWWCLVMCRWSLLLSTLPLSLTLVKTQPFVKVKKKEKGVAFATLKKINVETYLLDLEWHCVG